MKGVDADAVVPYRFAICFRGSPKPTRAGPWVSRESAMESPRKLKRVGEKGRAKNQPMREMQEAVSFPIFSLKKKAERR